MSGISHQTSAISDQPSAVSLQLAESAFGSCAIKCLTPRRSRASSSTVDTVSSSGDCNRGSPPKWKKAVSDHNKSLLGQRGLGRYARCVAAEVLLPLPAKKLRELAVALRDEAERDWESFDKKWDNRDEATHKTAARLLKMNVDPPKSKRKRKFNAKKNKS